MDRIVPISEARASLSELIEEARKHEIYLLKHGHPVGVLLSVAAYEKIVDRIEELEDTVSVLRSQLAPDTVPFEPSTHTLHTSTG